MLKCFKCSDRFTTVDELCDHLKDDHNLKSRDKYICSIPGCESILNQRWKYKRHIQVCYRNTEPEDESENEHDDLFNDLAQYQNDKIMNLQRLLRKSAMEMACKMSGNMLFPRNAVFDIIADFEKFLKKISEGLESIMMSCVATGCERTVEDFMEAINSSFIHVQSERRFDTELKKKDLISPVIKIDITKDEIIKNIDADYEDTTECEEFDDCDEEEENYEDCYEDTDGDENENEQDTDPKTKTETITEMPIEFQLKKFLELPKVFEKIQLNLSKLNEQNTLQHFVNGSLWKEIMTTFPADRIVLPYFLYMDEAQINSTLGSHARIGKENFCYYSLPTIPNEYQSRLENIFVAALHPGEYCKDYGNERCFNSLIESLTKLTQEGIEINVDGEIIQIYFVLGLFLGDNLEVNNVLGFAKAFSAHYYCRICKLHMDDMQTQTKESASHLRNRENYNEDVIAKDFENTGIHENCVFNEMPFFHATENAGVDLMHDVLWGILHYNLAEVILHFIKKHKSFMLATLNERMKSFAYGMVEMGNLPPKIFMKKLKTKRFTMSASEMHCFATHLPFLIGDLVPRRDKVWQFYLLTMQFMEMCYLPSYTAENIQDLENCIDKMNSAYIKLFKQKLKPKHHLAIHYPRLTKRFGPLRYIQSIRFEAKHRAMKNYTKNTNSRVNISYSLARKLQYILASRLLEKKGLEDEIITNALKKTWVAEEGYYANVADSIFMPHITSQECFVTNKAILNGITFAYGLWLPDFTDENNKKVNEILDIILISPEDPESMFAVCQTYSNVEYDQEYGCHFVNMESHRGMSIVKISDFLLQHHCPVKPHEVANNFMFRCKRF